jgi:hypothetical protein
MRGILCFAATFLVGIPSSLTDTCRGSSVITVAAFAGYQHAWKSQHNLNTIRSFHLPRKTSQSIVFVSSQNPDSVGNSKTESSSTNSGRNNDNDFVSANLNNIQSASEEFLHAPVLAGNSSKVTRLRQELTNVWSRPERYPILLLG